MQAERAGHGPKTCRMEARWAETREMRGSVRDSLAAQRHAQATNLRQDRLLMELTETLNYYTRSNTRPGFQIR